MQVNPTAAVLAVPVPTGATNVRIVAGDLATVPLGALLQAVVTQVNPREAVLNVNGASLTIRPPTGLQLGAVLLVRVPNATTGTLEIADPKQPLATSPRETARAEPAMVKLVEVTATLPDGRVRVQIDGQEQLATTSEPLPTGRFVLEVTRTPAGVVLRTPPERPTLPSEVANAILRVAPPPDFTATLKPLQAEVTSLVQAPVPASVRDAAVTVRDTVRGLLPAELRALSAPEIQHLVEDAGIQYEAKLARMTTDAPKADLKGDLLRLLQTAQELGVATQVPAARAALEGVETQQATQTLAQASGTPYILQIPFPDGGEWRTLHLAVEREGQPGHIDPDRTDRFRMFMHVPLTELGDTWIDAGLYGNSFRAAIYLDRADVRARVSTALPELHAELRNEGFGEVLLDVRSTDALPENAKRQSTAMSAGRPSTTSILDVKA